MHNTFVYLIRHYHWNGVSNVKKFYHYGYMFLIFQWDKNEAVSYFEFPVDIFILNKYLFVATILWEILNWNHLREESDVNVKTCGIMSKM